MKSYISQTSLFFLIAVLIVGITTSATWSTTSAVSQPAADAVSVKLPHLPAPGQNQSQSVRSVTISGQIIDPSDTPTSNLRVQAILDNGQIADEVRTGLDGTFHFATLQTETYRLQVLTQDGRPLTWENDSAFEAPAADEPPFIHHEIRLRERMVAVADMLSAQVVSTALETQPATVEPVRVNLQGTGHISGTVTAVDSNQPLARVIVWLYRDSGDRLGTKFTDTSGHYHFTQLDPGGYKLEFAPSSVGDSRVFLSEYYADQSSLDDATIITIAGDEAITANAQLTRGGTIEGIVSGKGTPLERVSIQLYDADGKRVESDLTDETGGYRFQPLPPGAYKLKFEPSSLGPSSEFFPEYYADQSDIDAATPISITADETVTINVQLTRGGIIEGVITGEGTPLQDSYVRLYNSDGKQVESDWADEMGRYHLLPLLPGPYRLEFAPSSVGLSSEFLSEFYDNRSDVASATSITITADETFTANAELARGGKIRGEVTDEATGAPLADVRVTLYTSDGRYVKVTTTDASGVYTATALPTDGYRLKFDPLGAGPSAEFLAEYYVNKESLNLADEIQVTAPNVADNVNIQLRRGAKITGQVTNTNTQRIAGIPLPTIHVSAYDLKGYLVGSTTTDANGMYTITRLIDGVYWIDAHPATDGPFAAYLPGHFLDPTTVTAPELISDINMALEPGGQITGRVTSAVDGLPLDDVAVELYDATEDYFIDSVTTNADGYYTSTGLYGGSYQLKFEPPFGNSDAARYLDTYYGGSANLASSTTVVVADKTLVGGINATLTLGGQITGTVIAQDTGLPLTSIEVIAYDATGDAVESVSTTQDGVYALTGLSNGGHRIRFRPQTNSTYQETYYNGQPSLTQAEPINVVTPATVGKINATLFPGGRITGTVTANDDSHPLADVQVRLYDVNGQMVDSVDTDDTTGVYDFRGLSSGDYRLQFERSSYSSAQSRAYVSAYSGGKADLVSAETIRIAAPNTVVFNAALARGGQITGQIVDATDNAPLDDVRVALYSATTGDYIDSVETDSHGNYVTQGLPKDSYWLAISSSSNLLGPVVVTTPNLVENVNVSLPHQTLARGTVAGRIIAQNAPRPLAGVRVELESCPTYASDYTNHLGIYYFDELPGDAYSLFLEPDDRSPSAPYRLVRSTTQLETDEQRIDRFVMNHGGRIAGKVTAADTGQPLDKVFVDVYDADNNEIASVQTDALGAYLTVGLADGMYRLRFSPGSKNGYLARYSGNQLGLDVAQTITVNSPNVSPNHDAILPRGGQITGVVTAGDTGFPFGGVEVTVYDSAGNRVYRSGTDAQGRYITHGLPTGSYRLFLETEYADDSAPYVSVYYPNKFDLASAGEVAVTAPDLVTGIDIALQRGGQIAGFVTADPSGQPLDGVDIYVYDAAGNYIARGDTNRVGFYKTNAVRAGDYRVRFEPSSGSCNAPATHVGEYYTDQDTLESATLIPVSGTGVVGNIDAALRVVDPTPTPNAQEIFLPLIANGGK